MGGGWGAGGEPQGRKWDEWDRWDLGDGGAGRGREVEVGARKIFSNRWKSGEKFFQSLEKSGRVFQPLETFFQSLENGRFGGELADCAEGGAPSARLKS